MDFSCQQSIRSSYRKTWMSIFSFKKIFSDSAHSMTYSSPFSWAVYCSCVWTVCLVATLDIRTIKGLSPSPPPPPILSLIASKTQNWLAGVSRRNHGQLGPTLALALALLRLPESVPAFLKNKSRLPEFLVDFLGYRRSESFLDFLKCSLASEIILHFQKEFPNILLKWFLIPNWAGSWFRERFVTSQKWSWLPEMFLVY